MELKQAQSIAVAICQLLQPHTHRINIAGSVRRKKPEVKDIEIICQPKKGFLMGGFDLFGKKSVDKMIADANFAKLVLCLGEVTKGNPDGRYMQIMLPQGIALDLFMPEIDDYFRQYAIRTGSADYSFNVIARGWRKIGWVGSDLGLRLEKDCIETKQPDGKSKWTCVQNKANKPPVWESEQEFFAWLQVPFVKPEFRNI